MALIDMASLPDGFDEETSFNLGIAVLALAFGLDARELAPASVSGSTRADALLQHLKQRGKGPGQIIQLTEQLIDFKVLPPYLQLVFDFQDDEQDRQAAETKEIRSRRWRTAIDSAALDTRTSRQQMLEVGDLDRSQYELLELKDGRLPDGTDILALFQTKNAAFRPYLSLGIADFNPFDVDAARAEEILPVVRKKMAVAYQDMVDGTNQNLRWIATQALYALKALEEKVKPPEMNLPGLGGMPVERSDGTPKPVKPGDLPVKDERLRDRDPLRQSPEALEVSPRPLRPDDDMPGKEKEVVPSADAFFRRGAID